MRSARVPLLARLALLVCALAAFVGPGVFAGSAVAEEATTAPTKEVPTGEEAINEPVAPVKEAIEKSVTPEATTSPQTTPSSSGESSSSSTATPTAPTKTTTEPPRTGSSSTSSAGHGGGGDVHRAGGLVGATPDTTETGSQEVSGVHASSSETESTAPSEAAETAVPTTSEPREPSGEPERRAQATNATPAPSPSPAAKLSDAQAVDHHQATHPDPAPSPITTVGHVLSRPFVAPTSSSGLLVALCFFFVAVAIAAVFWFELGGGTEVSYWSRTRLAGLLDLARRRR